MIDNFDKLIRRNFSRNDNEVNIEVFILVYRFFTKIDDI